MHQENERRLAPVARAVLAGLLAAATTIALQAGMMGGVVIGVLAAMVVFLLAR